MREIFLILNQPQNRLFDSGDGVGERARDEVGGASWGWGWGSELGIGLGERVAIFLFLRGRLPL